MTKNSIEKFATTSAARQWRRRRLLSGDMCRNKSLQVLLVGLTCLLAATVGVVQANDNLRVAFQWKQVDFNYPSEALRRAALASGSFVPENVIPVGLEVYKSRLFLTLPRWRTGVPASLVYIDMNGNDGGRRNVFAKLVSAKSILVYLAKYRYLPS